MTYWVYVLLRNIILNTECLREVWNIASMLK